MLCVFLSFDSYVLQTYKKFPIFATKKAEVVGSYPNNFYFYNKEVEIYNYFAALSSAFVCSTFILVIMNAITNIIMTGKIKYMNFNICMQDSG